MLYGYQLTFEIPSINIFEFIRSNTDELLWAQGFRPAFSEAKYVKSFEDGKIELVPSSKFKVTIEPQEKVNAEERLKQIQSQIKEIADTVAQGSISEIKTDKEFVLLVHRKIVLETLLPRWYSPAIKDSETTLQEFKTFTEDRRDGKSRQIEVTLSKKGKDMVEIRVTSKDLDLARTLIDSIQGRDREA
jgi:hypothetical protein